VQRHHDWHPGACRRAAIGRSEAVAANAGQLGAEPDGRSGDVMPLAAGSRRARRSHRRIHPLALRAADGTTIPIKMMGEAQSIPYAATASYQAAALPYQVRGGRRYELVVVLPASDLATFEPSFDSAALERITLSLSPTLVEIQMSRVTLRTPMKLKPTLSAMGMPTAFSSAADFGGTAAPPPGWIQEVVHEGVLAIDETSTLAAAGTAVIEGVDGSVTLGPPPPTLRLDRPFLIVIRNADTGTVLFLGRVANPTG
jgi:serpin B